MQRAGGLLRVGDDRHQKVRDSVVNIQLDLLRVDEYQLDLVRTRLVEHRYYHAVDTDRLTRTGRTGDQYMRHLRDIEVDRIAGDVHAETGYYLALRVFEAVVLEQLADVYGRRSLVRNLDADRLLARDRGFDSNAARREVQRDVVDQIDDGAHLCADLGLQLIARDCRSA